MPALYTRVVHDAGGGRGGHHGGKGAGLERTRVQLPLTVIPPALVLMCSRCMAVQEQYCTETKESQKD